MLHGVVGVLHSCLAMKKIHLQFERSFYLRQGLVLGVTLFVIGVPFMVLRTGGLLLWLLPLLGLAAVLLSLREWRIAARLVDEEGVTRYDGKRFFWDDLEELREVNQMNRCGQPGALNHMDILFKTGRARILPMVLDPGYAAIQFIKQLRAGRHATSTGVPMQPPQPTRCTVCGDLGPYHRAMQKHGDEEEDTFLPATVKGLKFVKEMRPGETRSPSLLRCPECGSYFLFKVSYEYLATGSEDEQELCRMTPEQAETLLHTR